MNAFLSSLERSFNSFSQTADERRLQLTIISQQFRDLEKEVNKQMISSTTKIRTTLHSSVTDRPKTMQRARTAVTRSSKRPRKTDPLIKPAPYPVKNYALPIQPVYGPVRYYKPPVKDLMRKEEMLEKIERERYPFANEEPEIDDSGPKLVVTSKSYNHGSKRLANYINSF